MTLSEFQFTDLTETNRYRRGFTGHEHLNEQQLIHMNGRIYDYNLGRFMSVDPVIQSPANTQSVNPYSYIMNNPLAGTDPTGYRCAPATGSSVMACGSVTTTIFQGGKVIGTKKTQHVNLLNQSEVNGASAKDTSQILQNNKAQTPEGNTSTGTSDIGGQSEISQISESSSKGSATNQTNSNSTQTGLNLSQSEYLKAVNNGIWERADVLSDNSISNNEQVKQSSRNANMRQSASNADVVATNEQVEFLKGIYKETAKASNPRGVQGEKVIALGLNDAGELVVKGIAIIAGQGGDVSNFIKENNAVALAHVHYIGLETKPGAGDHAVTKFANIPNFTITFKLRQRKWSCCNLYEVGRVNNEYKYRSVKSSTRGVWRENENWQ